MPITFEDWRDFINYTEEFFPYERLYGTLNHNQLLMLIQDAHRNHWKALDLRDCGLHSLPKELGDLPELCFLALGNWNSFDYNGKNNRFSKLPMSVGGLKSLQALDLLRAGIKTLPESIGDLPFLSSIELQEAKIIALPESIGQLVNLHVLDLGSTRITSLPESIGQLVNLQILNLVRTQITALPESIGQLDNLRFLNLRQTQITALPESISQLSNLQTLFLHETQITTLPKSIAQISNLKTLDLGGCHLKTIPYGVIKLGLPFVTHDEDAENCVNLTHVTLDEGVLSLFEQPREVIEEYYRNKAEEEDRVNECKVIFLGDGAAGKSSLIERMIHDRFELDSLPTDGVKMTKWSKYANGTPLTLDGTPLTIRFLDFGGQEIMHSMHRCFLTAHTIYVVVCESRDDGKIDGVAARWIETVKSFAPECPVILALNKADLNPNVTINERTLQKINPAFRHTIRTSAKIDKDPGVRQLMRSIFREVPDCLRRMNGNRGWMGLKQELEDMDEDYILPEQFRKRCDYFHIREDLRAGVLNWFQDLGVAYAYQTTFQDMYVLNPAWLTNGIYRLILRTPPGGFLKHSVIKETLERSFVGDMSDKTYTGQEMEFILHIMRKFEISLNIPSTFGDGEETEMIPMKLGKTPPERYDEFSKDGSLHLRWEAGYLPNNLVHRLMIRKYPELDPDKKPEDKCVWRTGGWFRSADGGCEALAELTDREMDVYVRGDHDARVYMDSFRQQILDILDKLNIMATEYVFCSKNGKEGKIPYEDVLLLYRKGKDEIFVHDLRDFVSPKAVLNANYVEETRDFFISYNNAHDGVQAAWIANTLRENGYTVHFQANDCKPSMDFLKWMADSINHSRGLLAVLSSSYGESDYCMKELNAAMVRQHRRNYLLLPVRVEDAPVVNPLLSSVVHVDLLSTDEAENRRNLLKAAEQIRQIR